MDLLIQEAMKSYPVVMKIVFIMGMARMIIKPLMVFLHEYVNVTESVKDNELLAKLESSKAYKAVIFVLDYALSIKVPKQK